MNRDSVLRVTNAWFNLCEVGGRQHMHNYCNSVLSGTVYLRTDNQSYVQFQSPYHMNDFGNMLLDEANTKRPNRSTVSIRSEARPSHCQSGSTGSQV